MTRDKEQPPGELEAGGGESPVAVSMFRLRVLGGFALEGPSGAAAPPLPQRRAEAVLAVLAVSGDLGCTRERLVALLWPESDEAHSRHSLRAALGAIRQALDPGAVLSGGELLRLDPSVVGSDVLSFSQALNSGRHADAVRAYGGPLLDGFHVDEAPEFERWLDGERTRLARGYAEALERLATAAERARAWNEAVSWWGQAVQHDPLNSHLVLRQVEVLAAMGDRANAIKVADAHARRLREELDLEPDREVLATIERIRRGEVPPQEIGEPRPGRTPPAGPPQAAEGSPHLEPLPTPSGGTTPTPSAQTTAAQRLPRWVPWAGAAAAVVILALVAMQVFQSRPRTVTASDIIQVTNDPGVEFQPAISPDGNEVAYVAGPISLPRPYVRSTGNVLSAAAVRLGEATMGSGWLPAWSQDGQFVRFLSCRTDWSSPCGWMETGKLGGLARPILRDTAVLVGEYQSTAAWSPDGSRVAFVVGDTIFAASAGDTTRHRVAIHRTGFAQPHSLAWSPDGRFIAYANVFRNYGIGENRVVPTSIWIVGAEDGEPQRVTDQDHLNVSPTWLDERHLLFVSDRDGARALYVVEVGPHGSRGVPRLVAGVADPHSISYSIGSRRLAYSKLTVRQNIWSYPLGRSAPVSIRDGRPVTSGNQVIESSDVSPDGRWILYNGNRRGRGDLYKMPLAGGESVPLTETPEDEAHPRWSPDGREIAFTLRGAQQTIWVMPAEGGRPLRITGGAIQSTRPRWSRDGLRIMFLGGKPPLGTADWRAWVVSRDSLAGPWHEPVMLADVRCWPLGWIPDGTGVLCESRPGDMFLISTTGRVQWRRSLALSWTEDLRLSRDGKTVYFSATHQDGRRGIWAIADGGRGAVRLVVAFDDPSLVGAQWLSVGADRLYLSVAEYESDIWVAMLRY